MSLDIAHRRLYRHHIAGGGLRSAADVVALMGAVQAQDYPGSLWAVGLRMRAAVERDIEQALADRTIIRTWPMRGTLHFVAAADIRWMLELLTPRIVAANARRLRRDFGLDEAVFARCKKVLTAALQDGKQLSRNATYRVLDAARISPAEGRGLHILWRLAQDGVICFGARDGNQQTFALLDEWAPPAGTMKRDEALSELTRRYFSGHGPATLQDFVWWSGLATADARAGIEMVKGELKEEKIGGQSYWFSSSIRAPKPKPPAANLLPAYDEYTVGYRDRSAVFNPVYAKNRNHGYAIFNPTIVVDGQIVGTWKRALDGDSVVVIPSYFTRLTRDQIRAVGVTAKRYGTFLNRQAILK